MNDKTIYIAGKITDNPNYQDDFANAVLTLKEMGYTHIINPCCLSHLNLRYEQYMIITFGMIDASDEVFLLSNWEDSNGAKREYLYAVSQMKTIIRQEEVDMC